jgi:hypothetical protein
MACNCGKKGIARAKYVHTDPTGKPTVYNTEPEAKAAVARKGGTYKQK